jgi:hypothetical protein
MCAALHGHTHHVNTRVVLACFAIAVVEYLLRPFVDLFLGEQLAWYCCALGGGAYWILAAILLTKLFFQYRGWYFLKLYLVLAAGKIIYFVVIYGDRNFAKDYIVLMLFSLMMIEDRVCRRSLVAFFDRWKYPILALGLLTFLPFMHNTRTIGEGLRIDGLWDRSKHIQWFLIAYMLLLSDHAFIVGAFLYGLAVLGGARAGILSASFVMVASLPGQLKQLVQTRRKTRLCVSFAALSMVILVVACSGTFWQCVALASDNLAPLFTKSVTDDTYGNGRTYLNRVLWEDYECFSVWEKLLGRSRSRMADLYEAVFGTATWPHNDFAEMLYVYGLGGVGFYFYLIFVYPLMGASRNTLFAMATISGAAFILAATSGFCNYRASLLFILGYGYVIERQEQNRRSSRDLQPV